jgi:hypothetical protein
MPGGDRTGPFRTKTGKGMGMGKGRNRPGSGPGGYCVCPNCGQKEIHQRGVPCYSILCPECGVKMVKG